MKKKKRKFLKLNNEGSTLVIILVLATFITILAVIVTTMAFMNLKMKIVNKQSSMTFYTSEDAVNEIYAALGKVSMESFNSAYTQEIASVSTGAGGAALGNIDHNSNLRVHYARLVLNTLGANITPDAKAGGLYTDTGIAGYMATTQELEKFKNNLTSYWEDTSKFSLVSIGSLKVDNTDKSAKNDQLTNYKIIFTDCVIKYLDSSTNYYSYITFNGEIGMPDTLVDFVAADNRGLTGFTDYALIGNGGIIQSASTGSTAGGTINGNAYAGAGNGVTVNANATLTVSNGSLVTAGDINVGDSANLHALNENLWCNNIQMVGDSAKLEVVAKNSNTYVADDIQMNGNNTTVAMEGNYYGYGYKTGTHDNSSAVILNGKNATLNFSKIATLVIAGRAYVDYSQALLSASTTGLQNYYETGALYPYYETGSSLDYIGAQEIYLVPTILMNNSQVNPVVGDTSSVTANLSQNNFFGYSFLKNNCYTTRVVNGKTYYYLDFIDSEALSNYVKAVLDDSYYNQIVASAVARTTDAQEKAQIQSDYDTSRSYVKSVISVNIADLSSYLQLNASAHIYTNGSLVVATDKDNITNRNSDISETTADLDSLAQRDNALRTVLVDSLTQTWDSSYQRDMVFSNFVLSDKLNALTKDATQNKPYAKKLNNCILYAINNGTPGNSSGATLVVSSGNADLQGCTNGVIVASKDVEVAENFNGMILAGGTITIDPGVTVGNAISGISVESLINSDANYAAIFKAWNSNMSNDENDATLSSMTYKDLVSFSSWEKAGEEKDTTAAAQK